jgi:Basic tilted helix bundle domain
MNDKSRPATQSTYPPREAAAAASGSTLKQPQGPAVVRVVLLASGTGSDANTYMPNRSSTQWWNRRDALVRCAASALFGPASAASSSSVELVLLFDQDWSRMRMTYEEPSRSSSSSFAPPHPFLPTEQNVIRIWKQCCLRPHQTVSQRGFHCTLIPAGPRGADRDNHGTRGKHGNETNAAGSSSSSKRELLELLQASCPLDFLKQHRLNSSPQALLRKVNRDQLLAVYKEWCLSSKKSTMKAKDASSTSGDSSNNTSAEATSDELDRALREVLRPAAPSNSDEELEERDGPPGRVIAAVLHESSDHELPLHGDHDDEDEPAHRSRITAVLFAGAVRDMTRHELQRLHAVCQQANVPVVQVRLGPVAEFTSKVLAVAAFHHSHGRLVRGLCCALSKSSRAGASTNEDTGKGWREKIDASGSGNTESRKRPRSVQGRGNTLYDDSMKYVPASPSELAFKYIVYIPFPSSELTLELEARPLLWPLIRCVVNALWRSRVASNTTSTTRTGPSRHGTTESTRTTDAVPPATSSTSSSLRISGTSYHNHLVLVFADDLVIDLEESTVVEMAERHQAAPCEHQVLQLVLEQMNKQKPASVTSAKRELASSWSDTAQGIMERIGLPLVSSAAAQPQCADTNGDRRWLPSSAVALDLLHNEGVDLGAAFYKCANMEDPPSERVAQFHAQDSSTTAPRTLPVLVLVSLESIGGKANSTAALTPSKLQDELVRILSHRPDVDMIRSQLIQSSCTDRCAATVTLLQHVGYQIPDFFDSLVLGDIQGRSQHSTSHRPARRGGPLQEEKKRRKEKKRNKDKAYSETS